MVMRARHRPSAMSQINVVPFIDVVLVLLIIFMVTAPMLQIGQIELPKVGQASSVAKRPIEVRLKANETWSLRGPGISNEEQFDSVDSLIERLGELPLKGENAAPVVLAADKSVQYGEVVHLLDQLKKQNIPQVGLLLQIDSRR
ncbi:MAG: biopolymer transporter ExbD [Pseudomonadota bacterium]